MIGAGIFCAGVAVGMVLGAWSAARVEVDRARMRAAASRAGKGSR